MPRSSSPSVPNYPRPQPPNSLEGESRGGGLGMPAIAGTWLLLPRPLQVWATVCSRVPFQARGHQWWH